MLELTGTSTGHCQRAGSVETYFVEPLVEVWRPRCFILVASLVVLGTSGRGAKKVSLRYKSQPGAEKCHYSSNFLRVVI